jgi:hypothetical protein
MKKIFSLILLIVITSFPVISAEESDCSITCKENLDRCTLELGDSESGEVCLDNYDTCIAQCDGQD